MGGIREKTGIIDGLSHQVEGDVIYQKQGMGEQVWNVVRARTKNSGLLIPSQHLFSLGGLLGEGGENVGQRKRNMGMERSGSKGNKILVTTAKSVPGTVLVYMSS